MIVNEIITVQLISNSKWSNVDFLVTKTNIVTLVSKM